MVASGTAARGPNPWDDVRLHIVTGKGGTGKTTVAAALALALASGGRRTLLVEVEERQGFARLFDTGPLPYEERKVAVAPNGGDVFALAVDTEAAFLEYLEMFYKLGRAGRMLKRIGAVDFATTIAPGLRDVILTGKVYEEVGRRRSGRQEYDAVVLDAPPTGRIARFLNVNAEVSGLARTGPIRGQADSIMELLTSARTVVHVVTLLEEMPVQETADGIAELASIGLPVGAVIVNRVRQPALRPSDLTALGKREVSEAEIVTGLEAAGIRPTRQTVAALLDEGADLAARVALEKRERRRVQALKRPTYDLPWLPDTIDLGGLYILAQALTEQGMR